MTEARRPEGQEDMDQRSGVVGVGCWGKCLARQGRLLNATNSRVSFSAMVRKSLRSAPGRSDLLLPQPECVLCHVQCVSWSWHVLALCGGMQCNESMSQGHILFHVAAKRGSTTHDYWKHKKTKKTAKRKKEKAG